MATKKDKEKDKQTSAEEVIEEPTEASADEAKEEEAPVEVDKAKEWEDKYIRLFAEFDNFKKRTEKQMSQRYSDGVIDAAASLLNVLDNIERALNTKAESDDAKQLHEGVSLVKKQFEDGLTSLGITAMETVGEEFDPNIHNAVMHIEDESIDDNTIVEEFSKGYQYKDGRVVRHPMVKVAN